MGRFISMGEKLGMSGKELKDWVTEEMNKERDECAAQRENERGSRNGPGKQGCGNSKG